MSPLEVWLNFLVSCQLKQIWVRPFVVCGIGEALVGFCGRRTAGSSPSIIVINHHVKTFVHHRKRFSFREELSGDVGSGSQCLLGKLSPSWRSVKGLPSSVTVTWETALHTGLAPKLHPLQMCLVSRDLPHSSVCAGFVSLHCKRVNCT